MTTGYEVKAYNDLGSIAQSMNRIANCMEAAEKRARMTDPSFNRSSKCNHPGCTETVIVMINGQYWCLQHIDAGFQQIRETVDALQAGGIIPTPVEGA